MSDFDTKSIATSEFGSDTKSMDTSSTASLLSHPNAKSSFSSKKKNAKSDADAETQKPAEGTDLASASQFSRKAKKEGWAATSATGASLG